ncbi:MAG: cation diffusion facilitator family transporter [Deltaproteobacteria bacterium]
MKVGQPRDPRVVAGIVSVLAGTAIVLGKAVAYQATGSSAILSDAFEGLTNVVAASFSLGAILFSREPPDREHPYGHGKIEHLSAVFEGGLIAIAAILTAAYAARDLWLGPEVAALDFGLALTVATGTANALLGAFLIRTGQTHGSVALIADGRHVLADFKTTIGVLVGLGIVRLTGFTAADPIAAMLVAVNLAVTGYRLVREGAGALLDEIDPSLLGRIVDVFSTSRRPGLIRLHHLRAIRAGSVTHIDAHLIVPEFWSVEDAHGRANALEKRLLEEAAIDGDVALHIDPCERHYCAECDLEDCAVREAEFQGLRPLTLQEATDDAAPS